MDNSECEANLVFGEERDGAKDRGEGGICAWETGGRCLW